MIADITKEIIILIDIGIAGQQEEKNIEMLIPRITEERIIASTKHKLTIGTDRSEIIKINITITMITMGIMQTEQCMMIMQRTSRREWNHPVEEEEGSFPLILSICGSEDRAIYDNKLYNHWCGWSDLNCTPN